MEQALIEIRRDPLLELSDKNELSLEILAEKINELLNKDFQKLISILYRMDINESRLRLMLHENQDKDAGMLIAGMMVERQAQKIQSRKDSRQPENDIDEDETW